jgi:FAD/FMN-containing dehydrogenase
MKTYLPPTYDTNGSRHSKGEVVNDVHSRLNLTYVKERIEPKNIAEVSAAINRARSKREKISVAGGRHAMGGQQFLQGGILIDTSKLDQLLKLDYERGLIQIQSGITWPKIIAHLQAVQFGRRMQWTIAQKQTGCDNLSIGGAAAANVHGRGLKMAPLIGDIEEFQIVLANGESVNCSREHNGHLFRLAIGGYGLFGIIVSVTLRLVPKTILRRSVELTNAEEIIDRLNYRVSNGATYGDFQFAIDHNSPSFLREGILSTYAPTQGDSVNCNNKLLSEIDWFELLYLAHAEKSEAFAKYSGHYLSTDGQLYHSDVFQLATYVEHYHERLDARLREPSKGTEVISELYVPRRELSDFLKSAAELLRDHNADVIYGTVRLIEEDHDSFLAWAKNSWACVVLNLHTLHTPNGLLKSEKTFQALIALAARLGGSYYLTYHKYASNDQLLSEYGQVF